MSDDIRANERRSPLRRAAQSCLHAILRIMTAAFFVALLAASLADNHDYERGIDE